MLVNKEKLMTKKLNGIRSKVNKLKTNNVLQRITEQKANNG